MTHLRRYLEEHGVLYPEQLAEAVRRQQIYGGSLDTVLLELELVDPVTLGELLERACGFPVVPADLLDNGLVRPWTEIPEDVQRSRWVEPLAREGDEVLVAVHPDLPDDQLGKLLRSVKRLRPMVTPECCLEKVAAERHGSVVPQRYAVLCAAYLSAVKRRPSVSGMFVQPRAEPSAPVDDPEDLRPVAGSIDVVERAPMSLPTPPARRVSPHETLVAKDAPPRLPSAPEPSVAPPAAITRMMHHEADVLRRLEQARAVLQASRSRDAALEAIVAAAMVLSPRVGLFRARGAELVGLDTPHGHLTDLGGKLVSASEGSAAGIAMTVGQYSGLAPEADLRRATGASATTPCVLQRIQVRDRPVVFVYLDRDGAPIERRELEWLDDLAELAGQVFEAILKLRRQPSAAHPSAEGLAAAVGPTSSVERREEGSEAGWGPAPPRVRARYGDGGDEPIEPAPAEPPPSRVSTPEREHPDGQGPPPSFVKPPSAAAQPDSWRLSPDLAARALEAQQRIVVVVDEPEPLEPEPAPAPNEPEPAPDRPQPTPGPDLPEPKPEVTPPSPAPELDPPSPAPEVNPPSPAPEVNPPSPAPEFDPPSPAPEVNPPSPAPELVPPSPAPEFDPPSPGPEIPPPTYGGVQPTPLRSRANEVTQIGPPPPPPSADEDDRLVDAEPAPPPDPSQRPTVELPALDETDVPPAITRQTQEIYAPQAQGADPIEPEPTPTEPLASDSRITLSRLTMHSSPPPPPLPPPPMSAVDESPPSPGGRRARSATIHGLPPPELKSRTGATKRMGPPASEPSILGGDDDEVTIISLAAPIMPATARGRIELEDEDWVAPGSQLASDSQQGLVDAVIDAVVAGDADVEELHDHGDAALLRLMAQFPGPLEVLRRDLRALPPPSAHGPLVRTVIAMGPPIVPHIVDLFEHPNPDVRFYAAFVFHELRDPRCMRPLAKLAFDGNGDVRVVSMRVLETYRRADGYEAAAGLVREQLGDEARSQQLHAARAAGTLRDIGAIPQLIELLASSDRFIQESALESLCSITGQQHGLKPHRWRAWYEEHGHRHRVEWIIDSLRHRDLPVRRWAADELVRITGHRVPFSPMGDKRARDVAAKAWEDWWEARGRELFGGVADG